MIPETTREQILDALARFDREQRDTPEWVGWEERPRYRYAIVHEDRRYPVKQIIALATGSTTNTFSGGDEANRYITQRGFTVVSLRAERQPNIWWVNQGDTYRAGRDGGFLWSPLRDRRGVAPSHWTRMTNVQAGDVIVHYSNGAVRALGHVAGPIRDAPRPTGFNELPNGWQEQGQRLDVAYHELRRSIPLDTIVTRIQALVIPDGPLTRAEGVKQGYLWRFTPEGLRVLREASDEPWPEWAEAALGDDGARSATQPVGDARERRILKVSPGISPGVQARHWQECLQNAYMCTDNDWDALGDIRTFPSEEAYREAFQGKQFPVGSPVSEDGLWAFSQLQPGDRIIATQETQDASKVLGVGEVVAPGYVWRPERVRGKHTVAVRWDTSLARELPKQRGWSRSIIVPVPNTESARIFGDGPAVLPGVDKEDAVMPTPVERSPERANHFDDLLAALRERGLHFAPELVANYLLALQAKRFVILTGISGTGKTQLALAVAETFRPRVRVIRAARVPEGAVSIAIAPAHVAPNNRKIVLPAKFTATVDLPVNATDREARQIDVQYPHGTARLTLYKEPERNVTSLFMKDDLLAWFKATLRPGDLLLLEALHDAEGTVSLRFRLPQTESREEVLDSLLVTAVRPDWTDNRGLLGYHNPLTGQYARTPFLDLLLRAGAEEVAARAEERPPRPFFAILDEMNLARVEHYFADFLSALESGQSLHLHGDATLAAGQGGEESVVPQQLAIPANLFITGTVNVDETTYMFSPKVLDRAFTLEFDHVDLRGLGAVDGEAASALALKGFPGTLTYRGNPNTGDWDSLGALGDGRWSAPVLAVHDLLVPEHRHFGYRVANEIARFVVLAAEQAGDDPAILDAALDLALLQKVLPKFHGTQQELEPVLSALADFAIAGAVTAGAVTPEAILTAWSMGRDGRLVAGGAAAPAAAPPAYPRTAAKLWGMLRRLRQQGFASFIE